MAVIATEKVTCSTIILLGKQLLKLVKLNPYRGADSIHREHFQPGRKGRQYSSSRGIPK